MLFNPSINVDRASHEDVIRFKIKGLRSPNQDRYQTRQHKAPHPSRQDDGTREVKIFGCEYRVQKQALVDFQGHYGDLVSNIVEELFDDGSDGDPVTEGTNHTGTYVFKVKLNRDIPELVPISGKRIWISYPGPWGTNSMHQVLWKASQILNCITYALK